MSRSSPAGPSASLRRRSRAPLTLLVLLLLARSGAAGEAPALDGVGNNRERPVMNATHTPLLRTLPSAYMDGMEQMPGKERPSARAVSNAVARQDRDRPNLRGASDFLWQWGQFLDHDIDLTGSADPAEYADIPVPADDPHFDPRGSGAMTIAFQRSLYDHASGAAYGRPREQLNEITGWIDASMVYGSDAERAEALRRMDGTGRLATSEGRLLPWNEAGLPNAGGTDSDLFLAGDPRANEQVGLTAMHTLFVREHNRFARSLARRRGGRRLSGEEIYQRARRHVSTLIQVITYREFLPALLGPGALSPYAGYDPGVDASIANEFSTAAYRFGHSALSPVLIRLDHRLRPVEAGHLPLREAFFAPQRIVEEGGIAPILRGLARQRCQRIDSFVVDDVRNFLFGPPGAGGFDLAALNIQRGRDHGLPSYNEAREGYGLPRARSFREISRRPEVAARLARAYASVDEVELWVGGLAEEPARRGPGRRSHLGPLFHRIVVEQFEALRDGDRFHYRNVLPPALARRYERTRLGDVIRRNTRIGRELQRDVFRVPAPGRGHGRRRSR